MKTLNKILCKTTDFVFGMAEFIGTTVGLIVKYAIIYAFIFAEMLAILFLWCAVPTFTWMALFSEINSPWEVYALIGMYAAWTILLKIAYDRYDRCINNSRLDKFFEEFNKRA